MRHYTVFSLACLLTTGLSKPVDINTDLPIQAVSVSGRLFCGETPAIGIQVKLIDKDFGGDRDDLLDERKTDENGKFHVTGGTYEKDTIEPALKIYHDCNDGEQIFTKYLYSTWDLLIWNLVSAMKNGIANINIDMYEISLFTFINKPCSGIIVIIFPDINTELL